jgi:hypothetical protein
MMILASAVLAGSLLATGAQARGGGGGGGGHGASVGVAFTAMAPIARTTVHTPGHTPALTER